RAVDRGDRTAQTRAVEQSGGLDRAERTRAGDVAGAVVAELQRAEKGAGVVGRTEGNLAAARARERHLVGGRIVAGRHIAAGRGGNFVEHALQRIGGGDGDFLTVDGKRAGRDWRAGGQGGKRDR